MERLKLINPTVDRMEAIYIILGMLKEQGIDPLRYFDGMQEALLSREKEEEFDFTAVPTMDSRIGAADLILALNRLENKPC